MYTSQSLTTSTSSPPRIPFGLDHTLHHLWPFLSVTLPTFTSTRIEVHTHRPWSRLSNFDRALPLQIVHPTGYRSRASVQSSWPSHPSTSTNLPDLVPQPPNRASVTTSPLAVWVHGDESHRDPRGIDRPYHHINSKPPKPPINNSPLFRLPY